MISSEESSETEISFDTTTSEINDISVDTTTDNVTTTYVTTTEDETTIFSDITTTTENNMTIINITTTEDETTETIPPRTYIVSIPPISHSITPPTPPNPRQNLNEYTYD